MTFLWTIIWGYLACAVSYWLWTIYGLIRTTRQVPALEKQTLSWPSEWPALSVLVPACNEADKIEPAALSLLAQDYPDLQIVFVNDRSDDETGAIINRLAKDQPGVTALHIEQLSPGWLGKVNALHQGLQYSQGQFVLLTDADIHFQPETLKRAMAYGTLAASFTVEDFSLDRLQRIDREDIDRRMEEYRQMLSF